MQIELKSIKIQDLIDGYVNAPDAGVKGYHGRIYVRPINVSSVMTKSSNKPLWEPFSKAFRSTSCIGAWMRTVILDTINKE